MAYRNLKEFVQLPRELKCIIYDYMVDPLDYEQLEPYEHNWNQIQLNTEFYCGDIKKLLCAFRVEQIPPYYFIDPDHCDGCRFVWRQKVSKVDHYGYQNWDYQFTPWDYNTQHRSMMKYF